MARRKVAFKKRRQNRLGMILVSVVVVMLFLVMTFSMSSLRKKRDAYIEKDYWQFLPDTLKGTIVKKVKTSKGKDSSIVEGLALEGAAIDTLSTIMVSSETASQDGLNWGVNGIIVNQIARELGLPNTFDAVKGTSRLGYFDMMDFAGYNAGNGFFPAMPAAWERAYMGWSDVKEVRPV